MDQRAGVDAPPEQAQLIALRAELEAAETEAASARAEGRLRAEALIRDGAAQAQAILARADREAREISARAKSEAEQVRQGARDMAELEELRTCAPAEEVLGRAYARLREAVYDGLDGSNGAATSFPGINHSGSGAGPNGGTPILTPLSAHPAVAGSRTMVEVSKFTNFADLNAYEVALAAMPGIRAVKVHRFYKGTLYLVIEYEGILPLSERLVDVPGFAPSHVSAHNNVIEVMLDTKNAQAASSGAVTPSA